MFRIFYAGKMSRPQVSEDRMHRTDYGNYIADLSCGLKFFEERHGKFDTTGIETTHTYVGATPLNDKEEIFKNFQGEFCSEDFSKFISESDATHTSMSVGDILVEENSGRVFVCDSFGFTEVV